MKTVRFSLLSIHPFAHHCQAAAALIASNTRLTKIVLSGVEIEDEGARMIIKSLEHNSNLGILSLHNNKVCQMIVRKVLREEKVREGKERWGNNDRDSKGIIVYMFVSLPPHTAHTYSML